MEDSVDMIGTGGDGFVPGSSLDKALDIEEGLEHSYANRLKFPQVETPITKAGRLPYYGELDQSALDDGGVLWRYEYLPNGVWDTGSLESGVVVSPEAGDLSPAVRYLILPASRDRRMVDLREVTWWFGRLFIGSKGEYSFIPERSLSNLPKEVVLALFERLQLSLTESYGIESGVFYDKGVPKLEGSTIYFTV